MTRTRRILMVAFVATALSADRAIASTPTIRPQMAQAARKLAGRLMVLFRRSLSAASRLSALRRSGRQSRPRVFRLADLTQYFAPATLSPFQFRLPPPVR